MKYELDFIGINEKTKDADAIGIHWIDEEKEIVGVYDGGFSAHGEALKNIVEQYYFSENKNNIDFVICSHSDKDHALGLKNILENCSVDVLYMNRPWLYIDELFEKVNDGRITKKSLEDRLKDNYTYIDELEKIAIKKNIEIHDIFEGTQIYDRITVLSPNKDMYISLMAESTKNDFLDIDQTIFEKAANIAAKAAKKIYQWITETWTSESLREDVTTSAENETSAIILGNMSDEYFLLVGDAGIKALNAANDYYDSLGYSLKNDVKIYQIPHHGGRHNVNTSTLNKIVGDVVEENGTINKTAFVCAGKNSDHPLKMVTNAFIRRGVKVFIASGHTINYHINIPSRKGWVTSKQEEFSGEVEEWD